MKRLTCSGCNHFFGLENLRQGEVHLKCPRCKVWNIIKAQQSIPDELDNEEKPIDTKNT